MEILFTQNGCVFQIVFGLDKLNKNEDKNRSLSHFNTDFSKVVFALIFALTFCAGKRENYFPDNCRDGC